MDVYEDGGVKGSARQRGMSMNSSVCIAGAQRDRSIPPKPWRQRAASDDLATAAQQEQQRTNESHPHSCNARKGKGRRGNPETRGGTRGRRKEGEEKGESKRQTAQGISGSAAPRPAALRSAGEATSCARRSSPTRTSTRPSTSPSPRSPTSVVAAMPRMGTARPPGKSTALFQGTNQYSNRRAATRRRINTSTDVHDADVGRGVAGRTWGSRSKRPRRDNNQRCSLRRRTLQIQRLISRNPNWREEQASQA